MGGGTGRPGMASDADWSPANVVSAGTSSRTGVAGGSTATSATSTASSSVTGTGCPAAASGSSPGGTVALGVALATAGAGAPLSSGVRGGTGVKAATTAAAAAASGVIGSTSSTVPSATSSAASSSASSSSASSPANVALAGALPKIEVSAGSSRRGTLAGPNACNRPSPVTNTSVGSPTAPGRCTGGNASSVGSRTLPYDVPSLGS